MGMTAEPLPPDSFAAFERCVVGAAATSDRAGLRGQRAATLARRAGACDHLITAAFVHDFARRIGRDDAARCASRSADLLSSVFPGELLAWLRQVDDLPCADPAPHHAGHAAPPSAGARRLRQFIAGADAGAAHPPLPIAALIAIARRASIDG